MSVRSSWSAPYPCSNPSGLRPGRRPAGTSRAPGRLLTLRSCRRVSRFAAIRSLFASAPYRCGCLRSSLRSGTQTRYAAFVHLHQHAARLAEYSTGVHAHFFYTAVLPLNGNAHTGKGASGRALTQCAPPVMVPSPPTTWSLYLLYAPGYPGTLLATISS